MADYDEDFPLLRPGRARQLRLRLPHWRYDKIAVGLAGVLVACLIAIAVLAGVQSATKSQLAKCQQSSHDEPQEDNRDWLVNIVKSTMDTSQDPCEDFYEYSCGGWLKTTELPADYARYARSFSVIDEHNLEVLKQVLEEGWPLIGPMYESCMNTSVIDSVGLKPLQPFWDDVSNTTRSEDLVKWLAAKGLYGVPTLYGAYIANDARDPTRVIFQFTQGGLGLPDRDYYLEDSLSGMKEAYQNHIAKMFTIAGFTEDDAKSNASAIVDLETEIAKIALPRDQLRDPQATYNKYAVEQLKDLAPNLYLKEGMLANGVPESALSVPVNVEVPKFFTDLSSLVGNTSAEKLKAYTRWSVLNAIANKLGSELQNEDFDFYSRQLSGVAERSPRWKECAGVVDSLLGEALSHYFVERAFPGDSKTVAQDLVDRVENAMELRIPNLDWMDDSTRAAALKKLSMVANLIGYPTKWDSYEGLSIKASTYFDNIVAGVERSARKAAQRVGQPADRSEWFMTPSTVNAYYDPSQNQMVFPAGIIQPVFYNLSYPAAMNYGGIGMVIGHELTHGFDDQGRQFDGTGNMTEWWTKDVEREFTKRADCLANQYSGFTVPGPDEKSVHINGNLTLGENIADNGGLKLAYEAYHSYIQEKGAEKQLLPDLSNDQLFFLAFAQSWCTLQRPQDAQRQVKTDPHSPARYRVLGPIINNPAFAEAFKCKSGSAMAPSSSHRCTVW
eukprot:jgi/Chlat1/8549/Chrsp82S07948